MGELFALINAAGWSCGMVFARRAQQRAQVGILGGLYCSLLVNTVINLMMFLGGLLAQPLPPEEKMARLHGEGSGRRFTLLPFTAVGTASGLLLAVYSDYIELAGRRHRRALLALSDGPLSDGGGYQALWGGEEGRSREKSAAAAAALDQSAQQAG